MIVDDDTGEVLADGYNSVETDKDATSHAEINCLRKASLKRSKSLNAPAYFLSAGALIQ